MSGIRPHRTSGIWISRISGKISTGIWCFYVCVSTYLHACTCVKYDHLRSCWRIFIGTILWLRFIVGLHTSYTRPHKTIGTDTDLSDTGLLLYTGPLKFS